MILSRIGLALALAAAATPALACNDPGKQAAMIDAIRSGDLFLSSPVPEAFPNMPFVKEDGTLGNIEEFRGKPTIVSFWYPECTGCQQELPALNTMLGNMGDRDDINFVSISIRGSADHVKGFLSGNGYDNVEAHRDEGAKLFLENCLLATPSHLLLNRDGEVTDILMGAQPWDGEGARQMIERMAAGG